jgi:cell volume regulation protein A
MSGTSRAIVLDMGHLLAQGLAARCANTDRRPDPEPARFAPVGWSAVCREGWSASAAARLPEVPVTDVAGFGLAILVVSAAGLLAVLSNRLSEHIRVPAPAIFLIAAALAANLVPALGRVPVVTVQRVVTVMLIVLLFDGGMHIGWRRFRAAAGAVAWIGVAGTAVTALGVAALAHLAFGFAWAPALLLGVALAPTDPAVVFAVLGRREITGRSGTLLEGESGANDPVGIAAMAALLTAGGWIAGLTEFALQMLVGAAVGVLGGRALALAMRRLPLPTGALYPVRTLLAAGAIYGLATVAHGSGFLAVFVAGILVGDLEAPYKGEIERFHSSLASLAEIVAFAMLGLTVSLARLGDVWLTGLALAVLLALVVRPVLVGLLLTPITLSRGERVFVLWSGLKGAVPILLGTYLVTIGGGLYEIVIVVVAFSVIVQGGLLPTVARLSGVPMRPLPDAQP